MDISKRGVNWHEIRAEYIAGKSQRQLAEENHLTRNIIARHCTNEGWTAARNAAKADIQQKVVQMTAEAVAENAVLAESIKRKGLEMLDRLFDEYSTMTSTEHRDITKKSVDIKRLRDLTAMYKELTEDMTKEPQSEPVRIIIDV